MRRVTKKMLVQLIFGLLLGTVLLLCINFETAQADDVIVFPYNAKPCTCLGGVNCTCCHGIDVQPLKMQKNVCLQYTLDLVAVQANVTIQLDNSTIATFVVDPNNPPSYCVPVVLPNAVAMCVKMHDIKLVGTTGMQICTSFYVNYQTDQVFRLVLPCVQLSGDGISALKE